MESYFSKFRAGIIGQNLTIKTPYHASIPVVYADWTASGRIYQPIEDRIGQHILPFVANTHTDTNFTGSKMTYAYHKAQKVIKEHVGASENDVLISSDSGMTGVVNKFQRILGLKVHESQRQFVQIPEIERPVIFITHMEHHSNQTSWIETIGEVIVVPPNDAGLVCVDQFKMQLERFSNRKTKIAAITSCSNVTGIMTPYMDIAELVHTHGGVCFVDFACSAPYVTINMHEEESSGRYLDAIYFSPHKFLGGPGTTGILIFNKHLYTNLIPDNPGGGTVEWTNPWGEHKYIENIEAREDGGTPAFLQTIKAAMCMKLKEEMGVNNIHAREKEIMDIIWNSLEQIPNLHVLAEQHRDRLGIISFYIDNLHYNLGVKMLNDRFGMQTRGGCSCAGTYGHYLFNVSKEDSKTITDRINSGDCSLKPGWIRLSIHPTQTNEEIAFMMHALAELAKHHETWKNDYTVDYNNGVIRYRNCTLIAELEETVDHYFEAQFA